MSNQGEKSSKPSIADLAKRRSYSLPADNDLALIEPHSSEPKNTVGREHIESQPSSPIQVFAETEPRVNSSANYNRHEIASRILTDSPHSISRSSILIRDDFKQKLDVLSGISNVNICCLANNILEILLSDDSEYNVTVELRNIISKQHLQKIKNL